MRKIVIQPANPIVWTRSYDGGIMIWTYGNMTVYATPFYDDSSGCPIEICQSLTNYAEERLLTFTLPYNPEHKEFWLDRNHDKTDYSKETMEYYHFMTVVLTLITNLTSHERYTGNVKA